MESNRVIVTMIVLVAVLISGCATVKESYALDGRKAYALNCSGTARGWDKCMTAAGEKCGAAGYDVLDRSSEDVSLAAAGGNAYGFGASATRTQERSMLIACKVM
jgi:uncharacterized protein YceK